MEWKISNLYQTMICHHHFKERWEPKNLWLMLSRSRSRWKLKSSKHKQVIYFCCVIPGDNLADNSGLGSGRVTKTLSFAPVAVKNILRWSFNGIYICVCNLTTASCLSNYFYRNRL